MIESFVLYTRHLKHLDKLTDAQAGQLLKALYSYTVGEERAEMDVATEMLFGIISEQMDFDRAKWEETKQARRNAGLKSAEARANKKEHSSTKVNKVEQSSTNSTRVWAWASSYVVSWPSDWVPPSHSIHSMLTEPVWYFLFANKNEL